MKNISLYFAVIICLLLGACSKDLGINLDIKDASKYTLVYMPLSVNGTIEKSLNINDQEQKLNYSAYLGGSLDNKTNVSVNFAVVPEQVQAYNLKNGTNYSLMPEGSYKLENTEGIIPSGSKKTGSLILSVKTLGFIQPFQSYLLPITLTKSSSQINEALNTVYYIITGSYSKGEVPRSKVHSFGNETGYSLLSMNNNIIQKKQNGDVMFFAAKTDGTFETPKKIVGGWDVFDIAFHFGGNRLIARNKALGQDIYQYPIDNLGNVGNGKTIGFGWSPFINIVPFKGVLLGIRPGAGTVTLYPLNGSGDFIAAGIKDVASGWGDFKFIVPYGDSILMVDKDGDLYQYPFTELGVVGVRKKIGSGWGHYNALMAVGTDLLGLDANGDLWRYEFNTRGFWPL